MSHHAVTIRTATPSDSDALEGLSNPGSRPRLPEKELVAELDGTPIAAISLTTGAVAADLERADAQTIRSLRFRRYQILRQGGDVGLARTLLRRLAPSPHHA
jgi:hypothetical protein